MGLRGYNLVPHHEAPSGWLAPLPQRDRLRSHAVLVLRFCSALSVGKGGTIPVSRRRLSSVGRAFIINGRYYLTLDTRTFDFVFEEPEVGEGRAYYLAKKGGIPPHNLA